MLEIVRERGCGPDCPKNAVRVRHENHPCPERRFLFRRQTRHQMAFEAADQYEQICSLGPIIHSPQLVEKLEEKGVEVVGAVEDIPEGAVIIRSHGVTADEMEEILARELKIVDATCPFVKKAQEYAAQLSREGYAVVLVGEKEHPEVQGIVSYAREGRGLRGRRP